MKPKNKMTKEEILTRINSVKLCLMAHPDNVADSEFADRISDLEEIEKELSGMITEKSIIEVVKAIRKKGEEAWNQKSFCKAHNFNLEAEKYNAIVEELRLVCSLIENKFDLGYVSINEDRRE